MPPSAVLRVTVEVRLGTSPHAGQRYFRLSQRIQLPPELSFAATLPVEGEAPGEVCLRLPDGTQLQARALLRHDPQHPERGSSAELLDLAPPMLGAVQRYIEQHGELVNRW